MADKSVAGATNLLQRLALALSQGGADAKVRYAAVGHDPSVRLTLDGGFDAAEDLRNRILVALAARGFKPRNDVTLSQETPRGFLHVNVGSPPYDASTGKAVLDLSADGPYEVEQRLDGCRRDVPAERAAYAASVSRAHEEECLRRLGRSSVLRAMLMHAPFAVPIDAMRSIVELNDADLARRVARAFASQSLTSFEDLVEKAELQDLVGHHVAAASPRP